MNRISSSISVIRHRASARGGLGTLAALGLVLCTACTSPALLVAGESARTPESVPPSTVATPVEPTVLKGRVIDPTEAPLSGVSVQLGDQRVVTGGDGAFELVGASAGTVTAARPAWQSQQIEWDGISGVIEIRLEPLVVRALRVSGPAVTDAAHWRRLLELAADSAVDALVVDLKDASGAVLYETQVAAAHAAGTTSDAFALEKVLNDLDERGIRSIGRIVVFRDAPYAGIRPDLAARDTTRSGPWEDAAGQAWLDPTDAGSWEYSLALAEEACIAGFDEIIFDDVRFPTDGPLDRLELDGLNRQADRIEAVTGYLEEAVARLHPGGCAVAATVLGVVVSRFDDQGTGQRPEELSKIVDVLSPTLYPASYGPGWLGLEDPNEFPSEVVGEALDSGTPRLRGPAILRPWLQTAPYGPAEMTIEINEAEDRALGWMLWNAASQYDATVLPTAAGS